METQHNCEAKKKLRILDNELEVEKQKPSFNNDFTFKNEDYALESKQLEDSIVKPKRLDFIEEINARTALSKSMQRESSSIKKTNLFDELFDSNSSPETQHFNITGYQNMSTKIMTSAMMNQDFLGNEDKSNSSIMRESKVRQVKNIGGHKRISN